MSRRSKRRRRSKNFNHNLRRTRRINTRIYAKPLRLGFDRDWTSTRKRPRYKQRRKMNRYQKTLMRYVGATLARRHIMQRKPVKFEGAGGSSYEIGLYTPRHLPTKNKKFNLSRKRVCENRRRRRQVMFAVGKAGRGTKQNKPVYNYKNVKC
jgi:hypothetical protein